MLCRTTCSVEGIEGLDAKLSSRFLWAMHEIVVYYLGFVEGLIQGHLVVSS